MGCADSTSLAALFVSINVEGHRVQATIPASTSAENVALDGLSHSFGKARVATKERAPTTAVHMASHTLQALTTV